MEILRNILTFGEVSKEIKSSSVDKAHLRLASAKAVLRLSRHWDQKIPADVFHLTVRAIEIMPIAITNYQNSMLVASCAFLLELSGLSATMLRVDVAALRHISKYYSSNTKIEEQKRLVPKDSVLHALTEEGAIADSLARALADIYLQRENPSICRQEGFTTSCSGNTCFTTSTEG